ncbi:tetratricopeptide repeat protein [Arcobacter porcinus]|uniref:Tetratricopeptide repeat protein n=1 Tax=Arcobacter porcinus TaxID=1935204 RepID=A0ABX2YEP2_9BACT|nr:hypothetical protein [Arcobacter porcinus]OCL82697.1 hypothetical protein AAW29_01085 [Arcobacter porcinus]OCL85215.1 hypothetical protein AAW30_00359 [Arcobacter porcinus]OCL85663.1 hypothetical protein AAX30_01861 [Arcobacter porcinus]OCL92883.1 hypothetical protein AAX28_00423 [Arcobacter porcinus]
MYWYKKTLIFPFILLLFTSCSIDFFNQETLNEQKNTDIKSVQKKRFKTIEHKDIFLEEVFAYNAYMLQTEGRFVEANEILFQLYLDTNKYKYLLENFLNLIVLENYKEIIVKTEKYFVYDIEEEEEFLRYYSFSLLKESNLDESLKIALKLTKKYKNLKNFELLGNIYLVKQDYQNAYNSYLKALTFDSNSIASIHALSGLDFFNFNKKEEAVFRVEESLKNTNYNYNLVLQLYTFLNILKDDKKTEDFLKESYEFYDKNGFMIERNALINLIFNRFENQDKTILFFERNKIEDEVLVELYIAKGDKEKALSLANKIYSKNRTIIVLSQKATLTYELALEKKELSQTKLKSVIEMLEEIVKVNKNQAYYLNYLAYLLIDHDIDYERGIKLVREALLQEPNNLAYIDTLAWGEYKIKNCKEAYGFMNYIVQQIGLEDEEIKLHFNKIKECLEDDFR